jgi:phage terminase large subunit-like protein
MNSMILPWPARPRRLSTSPAAIPTGGRAGRWDRPIVAIGGSESGELTRDGMQRLLVGPPKVESDWGTGYIPKDFLIDWSRKNGVADALDSSPSSTSTAALRLSASRSYDQGRAKWQANTVDWVWFDEEPPEDVYSEGITRTTATGGSSILTFTPLLGMSKVVRRFLNEKDMHRHVTTMTIHDAGHISAEERERIDRPLSRARARSPRHGRADLGLGRVFPIADSRILIPPFAVPNHWPGINGIDFGWDHPTAAAQLRWDRDNDIIYLVREHRLSKATPKQHVATIGDERSWGTIPWAYPHDGEVADKGTGVALAKQYKTAGLKMLAEHATNVDGTNSVEAAVLDMLERMNDGRWKVFDGPCPLWMEEFRLYHRDDGKIVKEHDDLISASRYANDDATPCASSTVSNRSVRFRRTWRPRPDRIGDRGGKLVSFIPNAVEGIAKAPFGLASGLFDGKPGAGSAFGAVGRAIAGPIGSKALGIDKKSKPAGPTQDQLAPLSGQPRYGRGSASLSV